MQITGHAKIRRCIQTKLVEVPGTYIRLICERDECLVFAECLEWVVIRRWCFEIERQFST